MADQTRKKLQQVNVHLVKSSITDYTEALADDKSPRSLVANKTVLPSGVLYYEAPPARRAGWRDFLEPAFGTDLPAFNSKHASALLFFRAGSGKSKRVFVVTFGYGRALLDESALEADFGLRTALNLCNPDTLRAVNYRTIEERTRIGRIQLSDAGSVDAFHINMDTDLLRGLEADSKDKAVCERLGARWSNLIVAARVEIGDLPGLATDLLTNYRKRKLPAEYAWIDNVRRETDPSLIESLNKELESRVNNSDLDGIRLAMPEIAGSTVGVDAKLFAPEPDAEDFTSDFAVYLDKRKRQVEWRVETARTRQKVFLIDSSTGKEKEYTSVYRCIVAEFDYHGNRYLLVDGEWFHLNRDFVNEVNSALSKIPVLKHGLPTWKNGEKEGDWNERACKSWADAALLDKSNIPYGGGRSKIEPADILTKGQVFGHAKRRDKSSSGLSHLFAQGVVAARLICQDERFRKEVVKRIPASHKAVATKLDGGFDPRAWTIGYIILGANAKKPTTSLPFFSKVNLRGAIEQLQLMGYKIGIIGV